MTKFYTICLNKYKRKHLKSVNLNATSEFPHVQDLLKITFNNVTKYCVYIQINYN